MSDLITKWEKTHLLKKLPEKFHQEICEHFEFVADLAKAITDEAEKKEVFSMTLPIIRRIYSKSYTSDWHGSLTEEDVLEIIEVIKGNRPDIIDIKLKDDLVVYLGIEREVEFASMVSEIYRRKQGDPELQPKIEL
jgi:hypothetical protein